jgi:hypothetical protein
VYHLHFIHTQGGWAFCPSGHFAAYKGNFLESPKFIPFISSTGNSQFFVKKGFSVYVANLNGRNCTIV